MRMIDDDEGVLILMMTAMVATVVQHVFLMHAM